MDYDYDKIDEAVLALAYLTLHDGARVWKSFDWDALRRLCEKGYISDPVSKTKSVALTERGLKEAERLCRERFGKKSAERAHYSSGVHAPLNADARPMNYGNPQNPSMRRAYCMRPRPELAPRLGALGLLDEMDFLGQPTVVMTESLPFEGKLEGYRALILKRCKEAFLAELFEFTPLSELVQREALLGQGTALAESFDLWWTAEEVEMIEIETTW